jgi:hypothetical protein
MFEYPVLVYPHPVIMNESRKEVLFCSELSESEKYSPLKTQHEKSLHRKPAGGRSGTGTV